MTSDLFVFLRGKNSYLAPRLREMVALIFNENASPGVAMEGEDHRSVGREQLVEVVVLQAVGMLLRPPLRRSRRSFVRATWQRFSGVSWEGIGFGRDE
jgi:hypothetical protein